MRHLSLIILTSRASFTSQAIELLKMREANMEVSDFKKNGFLSEEIEEWTKAQNFRNDDYFNYCIRINQFAQKNLDMLRINNEDPQELLISTLYIRVLGIYQGTIILLTKGMLIEAKILARSLLEILYKIGAMANFKEVAIDFIGQEHIIQKKGINKINKLSDKVKPLDPSKLAERYTELNEEIKEKEIKPLSIEWFAIKAGLTDSYNTAFSLFSNAVHSSPGELQKYLILENNKVVSFDYGPTDHQRYHLFMTVSESMLEILQFLESVFDLKVTQEIQKLWTESKKLVEKYFSNQPKR